MVISDIENRKSASPEIDLSCFNIRIYDALRWAESTLSALELDEARASASRLLQHVTGWSDSELRLKREHTLEKADYETFRGLIEKRRQRIPVAYLTGQSAFWDLELEVGPGCLIPRPETENLVESVCNRLEGVKDSPLHILDLGAGSGAIGIALLRAFEKARVTFVDQDPKALEFTKRNLQRYDLESRAEVRREDFYRYKSDSSLKWDLILSNPPYLSDNDLLELQPELFYEPLRALRGGPSGLEAYEFLAKTMPDWLKPGGFLAFEMGIGQADKIRDMVMASGCDWKSIQVIRDYSGIERVLIAEKDLHG